MELTLIEDKKYEGFYSAQIEIENIRFRTDIVKTLENWKKLDCTIMEIRNNN